MNLPIPSWIVAALGSLLIVLSTAIGTILLQSNEDQMQTYRISISESEAKLQRSWDSHKLAENRFSTAELLASLIVQNTPDGINRFVTPRTSKHISDAVITMRLSHSDADTSAQKALAIRQPDCTDMKLDLHMAEKVENLSKRLTAGDLNAYDTLVEILDKERLFSACSINSARKQIVDGERSLSEIVSNSTFLRGLQISLNLLGLTIVLLKDLPIWRRGRSDS